MSIYSELKKLQKTADQSNLIEVLSYRRISIYFSTLFVKLKFSANFVTFLSLLADFLVIYFMYSQHWVIAGILVNLAIILDCSDGEVARYNSLNSKKTRKKFYGGFLDETFGTIGFTLVVFFAGYFLGSLWIGFLSMFGLFMILITSTTAQIEFPNKDDIAIGVQKKVFGNVNGRIGFTNAVQRIIVSLGILFSSLYILLLFAILANVFWLMKYWFYRNY